MNYCICHASFVFISPMYQNLNPVHPLEGTSRNSQACWIWKVQFKYGHNYSSFRCVDWMFWILPHWTLNQCFLSLKRWYMICNISYYFHCPFYLFCRSGGTNLLVFNTMCMQDNKLLLIDNILLFLVLL